MTGIAAMGVLGAGRRPRHRRPGWEGLAGRRAGARVLAGLAAQQECEAEEVERRKRRFSSRFL